MSDKKEGSEKLGERTKNALSLLAVP